MRTEKGGADDVVTDQEADVRRYAHRIRDRLDPKEYSALRTYFAGTAETDSYAETVRRVLGEVPGTIDFTAVATSERDDVVRVETVTRDQLAGYVEEFGAHWGNMDRERWDHGLAVMLSALDKVTDDEVFARANDPVSSATRRYRPRYGDADEAALLEAIAAVGREGFEVRGGRASPNRDFYDRLVGDS